MMQVYTLPLSVLLTNSLTFAMLTILHGELYSTGRFDLEKPAYFKNPEGMILI